MKYLSFVLWIVFIQRLEVYSCTAITTSCSSTKSILVERNQAIFQSSIGYPSCYSGRISCTWTYRTHPMNTLNAVCFISMPCSDSLKVSRTGDTTFKNQSVRLCGSGHIPIRAHANKLALSFQSARETKGGTFMCKIMVTPNLHLPITTTTSSPPVITSSSTVNLGGNCDCGTREAEMRIVGGSSASQDEYPWMGMLLRDNHGPYCAATIISASWIVTVAHCTYRLQPQNLTLLFGRYVYTQPQSTEQWRQVVKIVTGAFDLSTFFKDISLLLIDTELTYNMAVQPACLPFAHADQDFTGETVTIVGWGLTAETSKVPPSNLQKTDVEIIPLTNCSKALQKMGSIITADQICAYHDSKDACQGDSGGPMFWTDPVTQRVYLIGIVSYGIGCARSAFPGVYTRITSYLEWIVSQTGETFCTE